MKPDIHPAYGPVVFRDKSAGITFLTRSTLAHAAHAQAPKETITWTDGRKYPLVDVEVLSGSHPFYTGRSRTLDVAGRVEKFERRYGKGRRP